MSEKNTRELIVEAADRLFYQQGYEHTSFADIAGAVGISRGNFYHHFASKDEILDAVIALRVEGTQRMLGTWQCASQTPVDRIRSFIHILLANRADIKRFGCPVGTLCAELAKLDHASRKEASSIFSLFRGWLGRQFAELGCSAEADALAMHVLARSQGVATLASAFRDDAFIQREVDQLCEWLEAVAASAGRRKKRGRG